MATPSIPPKIPHRFLRWFCHPELFPYIEGDLLELYGESVQEKGPARARWLFVWEVLRLCRPSLMRKFRLLKIFDNTAMIRHNFLLSLRTFRRYKSTFLINLLGLSSGLACALFIFLWVRDEQQMGKYHPEDDRLYQVMQNFEFAQKTDTWDYTSGKLAVALAEEFPQVEAATTVNNSHHIPRGIISADGNSYLEVEGALASPNFLDFFAYDMLQGNPEKALVDPYSVVISEEMAKQLYHGTAEAMGQPLLWENRFFDTTFTVTGVYRALPQSANQAFDLIAPYEQLIRWDAYANDWSGGYAKTYLTLREGISPEDFDPLIAKYVEDKAPWGEKSTMFLQAYSDRYLYSTYENGVQAGGRIVYVRLFATIAALVLLLAGINFMNLSTAQASRNSLEVGVKKALGVSRLALIWRYLQESLTLTFFSAILALVWVTLLLPKFNTLTGKELYWEDPALLLLPLAGITVIVGLLAGSYPSLFLTRLKPILVLKSGQSNANNGTRSERWVRKSLVVLQFTISVTFMVGLVVVQQQIQYSLHKNMGYEREHVLTFHRPGGWYGHSDAFLQELEAISGVEHVSNMFFNLLDNVDNNGGIVWDDSPEGDYIFKAPRVGYGFFETLGMEILEGRDFSPEFSNESDRILVNEAAAKLMGLENPVGTMAQHLRGEPYEIIGVVKDFHYGSVHNDVEPMIFRFRTAGDLILLKLVPGTEVETIRGIQSTFATFFPRHPFDYSFMETDFQAQYSDEIRVGTLARYLGGLAMLIACLGLLGLAAYTAERRVKEVGVRKVLGAGVGHIIRLLGSDFTRPILIAIALALPISYLLMQQWLQDFAFHIPLHWWYFVGVGLAVVIIAGLTVMVQTLRVARVNPVVCLKEE
ncbi:MAG TPA: transporter permease [Cytophagales bacterium]|nr:transporter permease [Cytophagales bacterium]